MRIVVAHALGLQEYHTQKDSQKQSSWPAVMYVFARMTSKEESIEAQRDLTIYTSCRSM